MYSTLTYGVLSHFDVVGSPSIQRRKNAAGRRILARVPRANSRANPKISRVCTSVNSFLLSYLAYFFMYRLYGSQGNHDSSDQLIKETLLHVRKIEDRAHALRLRGRNKFVQKDFEGAYSDTIQALAIMGVKLPQTVTFAELDDMFDEIKAKLLDVGFDDIVNLPRAGNPRQDLIVSLMTDAATNAFWGPEARMADYIGLTVSLGTFSRNRIR